MFIVDDPSAPPPPNEESEGSRYPKRNIPRKRYDEMELPDEDEYICKYTVQTTCGKYTNMDNFFVVRIFFLLKHYFDLRLNICQNSQP